STARAMASRSSPRTIDPLDTACMRSAAAPIASTMLQRQTEVAASGPASSRTSMRSIARTRALSRSHIDMAFMSAQLPCYSAHLQLRPSTSNLSLDSFHALIEMGGQLPVRPHVVYCYPKLAKPFGAGGEGRALDGGKAISSSVKPRCFKLSAHLTDEPIQIIRTVEAHAVLVCPTYRRSPASARGGPKAD